MSQIIKTVNRLTPSWPNFKNTNNDQVSLVYDVAAPGTDLQNAGYGMAGLRGLGTTGSQTLDDLLAGNFTAVPTDIINGFTTFDFGSYLIVGGIALLVLPGLLKGGKSASRSLGRKAKLKGNIAREQALLAGS